MKELTHVFIGHAFRYLRQFLQGCGIASCSTPLCASNPGFPLKDPSEIAVKAVEMAAKGTGDLCPRLETRPPSATTQREIVAGTFSSFFQIIAIVTGEC